MIRGSRADRLTAIAMGSMALAGCLESTPVDIDASAGETTVELSFFAPGYAGAEVCVADSCGVIGEVEELVVRPPVIGSVLPVAVTRGEAQVVFSRDFSLDIAVLGLDPETARTDRAGIGLYSDAAGDCGLYLTNHVIEGLSVWSSAPSDTALGTLCGPFAAP